MDVGEIVAISIAVAGAVGAVLGTRSDRTKNITEAAVSLVEPLADQQERDDIQIRVTCAPHYQRILRQSGRSPGRHAVKGCMGGQSFAFISHVGKVQICGFLDVECGDLRAEDLDFRKIWETGNATAG